MTMRSGFSGFKPTNLFDAVSKKTDGGLFRIAPKKTGGRPLLALLFAVGAVSSSVASSGVSDRISLTSARADPPYEEFDVCQYMPNPYNNGQLQPIWELPGGYGLPGGSPVMCDPKAYKCYPATPGSGF